MKTDSLLKNTLEILLGKGIVAVLTLIFTAYFARSLEKEVFSLIVLYESLTAIMKVLTDLGLAVVVQKEVPSLLKDLQKEKAISEIIVPASALRMLAALLTVSLFVGLLLVFRNYFSTQFPTLAVANIILFACAAAFFDNLQNIMIPIFTVKHLFGANSALVSGSKLLENVFAFLFLEMAGMNYFFLGVLFAQVIMILVRLYFIRDIVRVSRWHMLNFGKARQILKEYYPFYVRRFFRYGLIEGEQLMVAALLPLAQLANFNIAKKVTLIAKQYVEAYADPLAIKTARSKNLNEARHLSRYFLKFTLLPIAILIPLSPWITELFGGDKYSDTWHISAILYFSYLFYALSYMKSAILVVFGKSTEAVLTDIVGSIVGFIATLILILSFGVTGLAWGQVLSFAAHAATSQWIARNIERRVERSEKPE